ncbi:erg26, C-3 sterol dehydrogenase [Microbotryomycetes sp. JL221]|nr:erg26, C-3 sterol dehydrogenase [Microbotryomycetes sp. JL221]
MTDSQESYAVIGGEGFLGQHLVTALRRQFGDDRVASLGLTQRTFDKQYRFFTTDITNVDSVVTSVKRSGATTIFHTASSHGDASIQQCQHINVNGTRNIVTACQQLGIRKLVFTSTVTIALGDGESLINVDERLPPNEHASNPYVATKAIAERIVLEANGKHGLLTCSIRPGAIIGPGERQVIPGFISVLKSHQAFVQMGSNLNLFDFVHVKDVVNSHLLAADRLDKSPVTKHAFEKRLKPVEKTVVGRILPTSQTADVGATATSSFSETEGQPTLMAQRTRFSQFSHMSLPTSTGHDDDNEESSVGVAGQVFIIGSGEPIPFWSFARAVWFEYNGHVSKFTLKLPASFGMAIAQVAEWYAVLVGIPKEKLGISKGRMQYVLGDLYFDIEKARRVLGYEPQHSVIDGIRDSVNWIKQEEAKKSNK